MHGTYIFMVNHFHEFKLSECSLGIGLILKRLHKLLNGHPLSPHSVEC